MELHGSQHPIMEIIDALRDKLNLDHRRNMTCLDDVVKALADMQDMSTAHVDGNVHGPVKNTWITKSFNGVLHNIIATDGSGSRLEGRKVWGLGAFFGEENIHNFGLPANKAVRSSFAAEVAAIEHAMLVASEAGVLYLAIFTDSLQAKTIIESVFKASTPDMGLIIDNLSEDPYVLRVIRDIVKHTKKFTSVLIMWVKAHTGHIDPISRLNEKADALAKQGASAFQTQDISDQDSPSDNDISDNDDNDRIETIALLNDIVTAGPSNVPQAPLPF